MKTFRITVNGNSYDVNVEELGASAATAAPVKPAAATSAAATAPAPAAAPAPKAASAKVDVPAGATKVDCPMPGTILKVNCAVGTSVKKGQVLLILEAMKMENEIMAPADGTVSALLVKSGDTVNAGDTLVVLG